MCEDRPPWVRASSRTLARFEYITTAEDVIIVAEQHAPVRTALGLLLAASGGGALAVQSKINSRLASSVDDPVAAATISFGVGFVLLVLGLGTAPAGRRGLRLVRGALAARALRPWQCLGGVSGAFLVITQGLTVATIGVATFTVAVVAGQVASGLAVDRAGLGPGDAQPLTGRRVGGGALAVVAVVVSVGASLGGGSALWLASLPAVAGMGMSVQQAFNGRVRGAAGNAFVAAGVNFTAGVVVLVVAFAIDIGLRGLPAAPPGQWWLFLGGVLGIGVVAAAAAAVRMVGVLLVAMATVTGQLVTALVVDLLFPTQGRPVGLGSAIGTVLLLVAVAVASTGTRSGRRGGRRPAERGSDRWRGGDIGGRDDRRAG